MFFLPSLFSFLLTAECKKKKDPALSKTPDLLHISSLDSANCVFLDPNLQHSMLSEVHEKLKNCYDIVILFSIRT